MMSLSGFNGYVGVQEAEEEEVGEEEKVVCSYESSQCRSLVIEESIGMGWDGMIFRLRPLYVAGCAVPPAAHRGSPRLDTY